MREDALSVEIIVGIVILGGIPSVVFASLSTVSAHRIFRSLAIATTLIYGVPTVTFVYFWSTGWSPRERGPLSGAAWNQILDYVLTATWLIPVATLSIGVTLAIRHRRFRTVLPYLGLFFLQAGWASLDTAFYVALID